MSFPARIFKGREDATGLDWQMTTSKRTATCLPARAATEPAAAAAAPAPATAPAPAIAPTTPTVPREATTRAALTTPTATQAILRYHASKPTFTQTKMAG